MKGGYDVLHHTIFMIVNPSVKYNSSILKKDLDALIFKYPFLKLYTIGYSVLGNPIYSVKLGFGSKQVCYLASTHANEYITTTLLMKFLENMCIAYYQNSNISGYNEYKASRAVTLGFNSLYQIGSPPTAAKVPPVWIALVATVP